MAAAQYTSFLSTRPRTGSEFNHLIFSCMWINVCKNDLHLICVQDRLNETCLSTYQLQPPGQRFYKSVMSLSSDHLKLPLTAIHSDTFTPYSRTMTLLLERIVESEWHPTRLTHDRHGSMMGNDEDWGWPACAGISHVNKWLRRMSISYTRI